MRIRPVVAGNDDPDIRGLLDRRTTADGRPALTEFKVAARAAARSHELVATDAGDVVGVAVVAFHGDGADATPGAELVVEPGVDDDRQRSIALELIAHLQTVLPEGSTAHLWAWRPPELAAATMLGLERTRLLVAMDLELREPRPPLEDPPRGVVVDRFRPGVDETSWLAANRAAFADHPETGAIDRPDLERRLAESWFDPDGFIIARRAHDTEAIVGYCWTKLHPDGTGEIYIIGVVPEARHLGLGKYLLDAGITDLAGRQGADRVVLYMDGTDVKLRMFYENRGFRKTFETAAFALPYQPNR